MRVEIDRDQCIGAANCVSIAPTVFTLDAETIAMVLDPDSVDRDTLLEAAEACPTASITVWDDDGNQLYP